MSYVEPRRRACAFCGRPIARRYWLQTVQGQNLEFCEPQHAELYETYWLPLYQPASIEASRGKPEGGSGGDGT